MPAEILVTRETLAEDVVFILQCLRETQQARRSTHMMDLREELANAVTLEFADYLRFLRKHEYATLDREAHTLDLTGRGDALVQGTPGPELFEQLGSFFADALALGRIEVQADDEETTTPASLVSTTLSTPEDPTPLPGPAAGPHAATFAEVLAAAPAALPSGGLDEPLYLRTSTIGHGPLATVYRARHAVLGLELAVKELRDSSALLRVLDLPMLAERFRREVSAQARLRHPGIVTVYDLDLATPRPFVVLELCEGGNLRERLSNGALPVDAALRTFAQLLSALAYAHRAGVVHLALKPENVLFDAAGDVRLSDFGLARLHAVDAEGGRPLVVDASGRSYLAPEMLSPGTEAAPTADVYAAGILFYELLTGRVPGRRSPLPSSVVKGVPPALDELFDRMTADQPPERYLDAGAALAALHAAFPDARYGSKTTTPFAC